MVDCQQVMSGGEIGITPVKASKIFTVCIVSVKMVDRKNNRTNKTDTTDRTYI